MSSLNAESKASAAENVFSRITGQFAPVELVADISALPPSERAALARIVEAAKIIDALFLRQVWAGNESLMVDLSQDSSAVGQAKLHAFLLNKGPWDRLNHHRPFLRGVPDKPAQANFYPANATKEDVDRWLKSLPTPDREAARGFFTTIRRNRDGKFQAVPYSLEYQGELEQAASLLKDAARQTQQPTLSSFLRKRADAFLSNDYYESDIAWMELDASIEPTIGPYEVYEDEWFNAKAAFEAFVALRDDAETQKLSRFAQHLQDIENHLPIEPQYRNPKLGSMAPIRVVNSIFSAGDGNRGVQTAAFNLPNDERTTKERGTKRVMLRNVQQAKFNVVLLPISRIALSAGDQKQVSFDAFFTHILMHELMHGLGPHNRQALQETYSALEEAKADISGLFALQYLIDQQVLDRQLEKTIYTTFLASAFRSIRFGIAEAHGKGIALQLNTLLDAGGFRANPDGTFSVDSTRIKPAVANLTRDIMTLQALGDHSKAIELLKKATVRPEVKKVLDRMSQIPVDIEPKFTTARQLLGE